MKLKKYEGNPILKPTGKGDWEKVAVLNPGVWRENGTVYMLYRASGEIEDYRIYFGLATSKDGYSFKRVSDKPVFGPTEGEYDGGCVEDARIVKFGEYFYVTYAFRFFPPGMFWKKKTPRPPADAPITVRKNLSRSGLLRSKDLKKFERLGPITPDNIDDRDAVIFPEKINGRYIMMHRPAEWVGPEYGCEKPSIWIAFSEDMLNWDGNSLLAQSVFEWESAKIGAGPPPIKTAQGWLVIYHGVDNKRIYGTGVMMLDLNDPRKVIARAPDSIMLPEAEFETTGIEHDVVFPTANIIIDGKILVYYGGADIVCCVAEVPLKELVDYVLSFPVKP
ncbi:MAG: glycosidase [Elusimicrobia bacterium]|nr:glycosidase [Elusimicrobiota bacterium]